MIDFQIACHIPAALLHLLPPLRLFRRRAQDADFYHLAKHKRRLRPDLMTPDQLQQSRRVSSPIAVHRKITNPLRQLRRRFLRWLCKSGRLTPDDSPTCNDETDPTRWANSV